MKRGAPTHPKMLDLAARLDVPTYAAVGLVEMLFHFAATHARRGDVGRHTDLGLARVLGWSGDASALVAALADAGWLDRCACHRLRIHDWPDHCDQAVRKTDEIKLRGFLECYAAASGGIPDTSGGIPDASGLPFPLPLAAAAPVPLPVPLPVPVPAAAAAGAPPPRGNPSELDAERTALARVLVELSALTGEPQDELCRVVSRTGRGKVFSEPSGCRGVHWLRATRDQAEARLSAARQRAAAMEAERRLASAAVDPTEPSDPEADAAWGRVLSEIEQKLNRHSFATWFRPTVGVKLDGASVVVRVPAQEWVGWLADNYRAVVAEALHAVGAASVSLRYGSAQAEIAASPPSGAQPESVSIPAGPEGMPSKPPGPPARASPAPIVRVDSGTTVAQATRGA